MSMIAYVMQMLMNLMIDHIAANAAKEHFYNNNSEKITDHDHPVRDGYGADEGQ